jgi:hypothetical protein
MNNGDQIPCSVSSVTVELMGGALDHLDREVVQHAAAAVLHYFHHELQRTTVTLSEFTQALETALRGLGLNVACDPGAGKSERAVEADLRRIASQCGNVFELGFFTLLRDEVRKELQTAPDVIRFSGLRCCVKQLAGARRWSPRCQELSDQIVEYLRNCVFRESPAQPCGLMVL